MSFQTHRQEDLVWHTSTLLIRPEVRHGFTTRLGGVSPAPWDSLNLGMGRGDGDACVEENYRRICAALGVDARKTVLSRQVHEDNVRLVTAEDAGKGLFRQRDYTSVDAMISREPGLVLVVFSADCGTVLLYDPVHRAIGAVHAGWRGVALGLAAKTVEAMSAAFGSRPEDLLCALGPSIGPCCFETDNDVPQALEAALGDAVRPYMERRGAKWHIDLKAINVHWLTQAGVDRAHVDVCSHCTACMPELYWSHRKMGEARGNQAAMISLCE